jgi:hypothetical protein
MVGTRRLEILTSIVSIWRELMASFVLDRDPSIKSFPNVFGHTQDQARLGLSQPTQACAETKTVSAQLPVSKLEVGPQTWM